MKNKQNGNSTVRLFLLLSLFHYSTLYAHNTSWTKVQIQTSQDSLSMVISLNQRDLVQNAFDMGMMKVRFANDAEFQKYSPEIVNYVLSHMTVNVDEAPIQSTPTSSWPTSKAMIFDKAIPLTLSWRLPPSAQKVDVSFFLYDVPQFSALFEVAINRNGKLLGTHHVNSKKVISIPLTEEPQLIEEPSTFDVVIQFIGLGFNHIIPEGLDHILFVTGLFLLSFRLKPLFIQVTAFTLAHSITLALSVLGIFTLPSRIVEPCIAISISFVAIENILQKGVSPWRWTVVFGFGLIHGLGFASALKDAGGLPHQAIAWALISFNVGVECGQLAVIGIAFLLTFWMRKYPWYIQWIRNPICVMIALIGLYWAVQRVLGLE